MRTLCQWNGPFATAVRATTNHISMDDGSAFSDLTAATQNDSRIPSCATLWDTNSRTRLNWHMQECYWGQFGETQREYIVIQLGKRVMCNPLCRLSCGFRRLTYRQPGMEKENMTPPATVSSTHSVYVYVHVSVCVCNAINKVRGIVRSSHKNIPHTNTKPPHKMVQVC